MDIAFNKPLDFQTLAAFLQAELPDRDIFLLDEDHATWEDGRQAKQFFSTMCMKHSLARSNLVCLCLRIMMSRCFLLSIWPGRFPTNSIVLRCAMRHASS